MRFPKINNEEIAKMLKVGTIANSSQNLRISIREYDFEEENIKLRLSDDIKTKGAGGDKIEPIPN